ncbi:Tripartite-type tricarboxylate transporter, receptor component TctC [Desulfuromusa kysingii]|uniref:Tripartite-type tricarboxylate transporter, receptor component TctC n=1 Tax=Desulfuromusa kysingii TaxID=37625 RepID=A0A1H4DX98_9BACT|nr:tripartite tricarboxylate transporter substrate binding protein [Desulfuromusa kysingii]SEA77226.1 Tripartite-type tricarboxylate transporter, receptor component TctC [Desulfuromusa kysingii]
MKNVFQTIALGFVALLLFVPAANAEYPERPVTLVVGFGVGGSADRMTRSTSSFLSDKLDQAVKVVNKKGAGTMLGANYVLRQKDDGYTVFASTFAPYMSNSIIHGGAKYKIEDFAFINAQWFDFDLIATNKDKPYSSLAELLTEIKNNPGKISASVVQGSAGHLMVKLLLKNNNIPAESLNLVTYNSGGKARSAVAGGQVDFIAISAEGCESIREFLKPLAVVLDEPSDNWDAPVVNEALKPLGTTVPVLPGSIRGYAVKAEVKEKYPERFAKLTAAFKEVVDDPDVKKFLKGNQIGSDWTGPEKTQELMRQNFEAFSKYKDLMVQ